jgi:hypothetical protein
MTEPTRFPGTQQQRRVPQVRFLNLGLAFLHFNSALSIVGCRVPQVRFLNLGLAFFLSSQGNRGTDGTFPNSNSRRPTPILSIAYESVRMLLSNLLDIRYIFLLNLIVISSPLALPSSGRIAAPSLRTGHSALVYPERRGTTKPNRITFLDDPHPLNPLESHSCKNDGVGGATLPLTASTPSRPVRDKSFVLRAFKEKRACGHLQIKFASSLLPISRLPWSS